MRTYHNPPFLLQLYLFPRPCNKQHYNKRNGLKNIGHFRTQWIILKDDLNNALRENNNGADNRDNYLPSTEGASRDQLCSYIFKVSTETLENWVQGRFKDPRLSRLTIKKLIVNNKNINHQHISPLQHNFLRIQTRRKKVKYLLS